MLRLVRFQVKKVVMWLDVDFVLQPGLTLVRGPNRSGKTLLFRLLGHILRSQVLKRGSSLSRLPKGGAVTMDFQPTSGEMWTATLTQSKLALVRDNEDQGSTGKRAPQQLLAQTLALPIELFDSTIHLQGTGDHPLVVNRPSEKLEWMAAVLDLTDAYERAAVTLVVDLERAERAARQLAELQVQLSTYRTQVPKKLPNVAGLRKDLAAARADQEYFRGAERLLDQLAEIATDASLESVDAAIARLDKSLVSLNRQLRQAEEYEAHHERHARAATLRERLAQLPATPEVAPAVLQTFASTAVSLADRLQEQQAAWAASADDRAAYANFCEILARAPARLDEKVEHTRATLAGAREQRRHLAAVHGPECPVCRAALSATKKAELLASAATIETEASARLTRLQTYTEAAAGESRLQSRLAGLVEPPAVEFAPWAGHWQRLARAASERQALRERLADLQVGAEPEAAALELDSTAIRKMIASAERGRTDFHVRRDRVLRTAALVAKLVQDYGANYDPKHLRSEAAATRREVEELAVEVATAETLTTQAGELATQIAELEEQVTALSPIAAHLPELLELKEAMGGRGLRLVKIEELAQAFQAEFNNLVPLLWDDPFVIDIEVKHTGLEIFATRNGVRDDLHTLSGSEMKVWKLLTALCLIRLLPSRLRCNTIILDELEANMDDRTRERFVADYLPELRQYVDNVILVSPLGYQDLPLTPTATYQITKRENVSQLRLVGGA